MPAGVTTRQVCKSSGLLATDLCKNDPRGSQVYTEYFVKGTEPTTSCTCHVHVEICADTGLLAHEYCPNRVSKIFITRDPGETGNWQKAADAPYMLTITDTCTIHQKAVEEPKPPAVEPSDNPGDNNTTNNNTTENNGVENNNSGNNPENDPGDDPGGGSVNNTPENPTTPPESDTT